MASVVSSSAAWALPTPAPARQWEPSAASGTRNMGLGLLRAPGKLVAAADVVHAERAMLGDEDLVGADRLGSGAPHAEHLPVVDDLVLAAGHQAHAVIDDALAVAHGHREHVPGGRIDPLEKFQKPLITKPPSTRRPRPCGKAMPEAISASGSWPQISAWARSSYSASIQ